MILWPSFEKYAIDQSEDTCFLSTQRTAPYYLFKIPKTKAIDQRDYVTKYIGEYIPVRLLFCEQNIFSKN